MHKLRKAINLVRNVNAMKDDKQQEYSKEALALRNQRDADAINQLLDDITQDRIADGDILQQHLFMPMRETPQVRYKNMIREAQAQSRTTETSKGPESDSDPEDFPGYEMTDENKNETMNCKIAMNQLKKDAPNVWKFKRPLQIAASKPGRDGYLNQKPRDAYKIAEAGNQLYNMDIKLNEGKFQCDYRTIRVYFKNLFHPLEFGDDDCSAPDYKTVVSEDDSCKKKILRLYRAVKDISREPEFGYLHDLLSKRQITWYNREDLDAAYTIYKDIIKFDIEHEAVTYELLKLARNPETAKKDVVVSAEEAANPESNFMQGKREGFQETMEEIVDKLHKEIDGQDKLEKFNNETLRQIALYKALNNSEPEAIYKKIMDK